MGTVWAAADISEKNTNVFHESLIKTNLNVSLASHQVTLDFLSSCLTSVCVWAVSPAGPVCVSVPLNSPQSPVVSRSASPAESTGCSADEPPQQTNKQRHGQSHSSWHHRHGQSVHSRGHQSHVCVSTTDWHPGRVQLSSAQRPEAKNGPMKVSWYRKIQKPWIYSQKCSNLSVFSFDQKAAESLSFSAKL